MVLDTKASNGSKWIVSFNN